MPTLVIIAQPMGLYVAGEPLIAKPDDYMPARKMCLPRFFLVKIPQAAFDSMPEMFQPFGAEGSPEFRARSWSLDLENLPTQARALLGNTGVLDATTGGAIEWNDIHENWVRHDGVTALPIGTVTRTLPRNGQSLQAILASRSAEFVAQLVAEKARGIALAQGQGQGQAAAAARDARATTRVARNGN